MSAQPHLRRIEVKEVGDITVVNFTASKILDEQSIIIIGEQLFSLVDEHGRRKLVVSFANVTYMSSAFTEKLITLRKKVEASGGRLCICDTCDQIQEVFRTQSTDKLFDFKNTEQEALACFYAASTP